MSIMETSDHRTLFSYQLAVTPLGMGIRNTCTVYLFHLTLKHLLCLCFSEEGGETGNSRENK